MQLISMHSDSGISRGCSSEWNGEEQSPAMPTAVRLHVLPAAALWLHCSNI